MKQTGPTNRISDVDGILVGNAQDDRLKSGVTVVLCDGITTAAVHVVGGAPGTRETDLLAPHNSVDGINALVLSGGSAFGLDAASGVQAALLERGIGFEVGPHKVPLVPGAILFDLANGGDKNWGRFPPYRELGYEAVGNAARPFDTGSVGAGTGALTAGLKGGLGSTSSRLADGTMMGALAAVNSVGSANIAGGPHFWAAPFELDAEFGGLGYPHPMPASAVDLRIKFRDIGVRGRGMAQSNTTIGIVATDAVLTKPEAKRLAIAAHDGYSRAIWPVHLPVDGDLIFVIATGKSDQRPDADGFIDMCAAAAAVMARAVARGVYDAVPAAGDIMPAWRDAFADRVG